MFLYFFTFIYFLAFPTREDTECLVTKPSTINCDLWSWFENMWMWEIIQNFDLPTLNSWWLAWNWLPAAAVEQKAETGKYTQIYKPTPNTPYLDIYYFLSILATVDSKTLECISMEMKRVAKWKLIESKTVRNSLVIWFMENVNHTAIIQHVPISNRLTHLTYDSLCHIAHAHSFSWSNHETSVQQSWFTWHTFNNEKAMLSISIHRCQNCLTLQERLMLARENWSFIF